MNKPRPQPQALQAMRDRPNGGTWAAYENHDLGHPDLGHLRFLKCGPECTLKEPPERYPDTPDGPLGWRYVYIGDVNLETGEIDPKVKVQ